MFVDSIIQIKTYFRNLTLNALYRFYDQGNAIYFTNRKGRVDATHSEYNPVTHTYNDEVNETLCEGD